MRRDPEEIYMATFCYESPRAANAALTAMENRELHREAHLEFMQDGDFVHMALTSQKPPTVAGLESFAMQITGRSAIHVMIHSKEEVREKAAREREEGPGSA